MTAVAHPYRDPVLPAEIDDADPEVHILYGVVGGLGALRLAVAAALGEPLAAEVTIAGAMTVAAGWGLWRSWCRRQASPAAPGLSARRRRRS